MKFDMHVHSKYSHDSWMEPEKMIDIARERGLDGIAVTDHGTLDGALRTAEMAHGDLLVIPGMEISTELGHVIGLFLEEPIRSSKPEEILNEIHAQDGIAVLPHPLRTIHCIPGALLDSFDAIEAHNARNGTMEMFARQHGKNELQRISDAHGIALLGGSDAHFYCELARGTTELPASDIEGVKAAIRENRTYVSGEITSYLYKFLSGALRMVRPATSAGTSRR